MERYENWATKAELMAHYKRHLLASDMPWVHNEDKMNKFMEVVRLTLYEGQNRFDRSGKCFVAAIKDIGLNASVSLETLRRLRD